MKWYDIPNIKVDKLYDDNKKVKGVLIKASGFEKLIEKMEDFLDVKAIEKAKKVKGKIYTREEINQMIENKK